MRRILLILCIAISGGCKLTDLSFDNMEVLPFISDAYYDDARDLYYHQLLTNPLHPNYDNPILDTIGIKKILLIIQAVYNNTAPERDSVFVFHEIHSRYCYSYNSLYLKVDATKPEIINLSEGIIPTGNDSLDELLFTYQFDSVRVTYSYPDIPYLTLYTQNVYNLIPIREQFSAIPSILSADFNKECVGGGDNITIDGDYNQGTITFSIGWGDCPAGCIHHRYWVFDILNGVATFRQSFGN